METGLQNVNNIVNGLVEYNRIKHDIFFIAKQTMDNPEFHEKFFTYIDHHKKEIVEIAEISVETKSILYDLLNHKTVTINLFYCDEYYLEDIIIKMYVKNEEYEKAALFRDVIKEKKKRIKNRVKD